MFCAALDVGAVREMVWCPTGAYDPKGDRMGLLALACTKGCVNILR